MALKDETVPEDQSPDARIAEALKAALTDGKLPCSTAFRVAKDLAVTPHAVGDAADSVNVHLSRCQLGLFGYAAKQGFAEANIVDLDVPEGLSEAIAGAQNSDGGIPCADLWTLAATYEVPRMLVGYVAEGLNIHITTCQLGAF